jgi:dipeptidyl aminopeptidase/acylaminoacyl peptidase
MQRHRLAWIGALVWVSALFAAAAQAQVRPQDVPLEAWASLPAVGNVTVSDDGSRLAYVRREGDQSVVVVQTTAGEILTTIDVSDRRFNGLRWLSPDHVGISSLVLEQRLTGGSHVPQLDIVNVRTRNVAQALRSTDRGGVINAVYGITRVDAGREPVIYVQAYTIEAGHVTRDIYRVDLDSGRGRRVATGQRDTRGYLIRPDGSIAARIAESDDATRFRLTAPDGSGGWRTLYEVVSQLDGPAVWGFGHDRDHVMISTLEDGQAYLSEINLGTGEEVKRTSVDDDPSGPFYDRRGRLVAMTTYGDDAEYTFFEPRLEEGWKVMTQGLPGRRLQLYSFSDDFQTIVVRSEGVSDSGTYFLYDGAARSVSVVGRPYPGIAPDVVGAIFVINYEAADGMALMGYLTLPPGREPANLPLIVMPHGGPASRDYLQFDWWAQAMASRGYAVFQPQFRGSDGFGEAHLQAGYGEWGRKMQTDLSDGVAHLVGQGMVDPERVCIVGASYGGYAALQGMTTQPDVYRCGVSVAGVADLPEMLEAEGRLGGGTSNNPVIRYWTRFMGADSRRDSVLVELSPARRAAAVEGPILLIHGRDDTVVPLKQSEIMHRALRLAGKDTRLVVLDGEDHWLSFGPTRRRMLEEAVDFLLAHNPPD